MPRRLRQRVPVTVLLPCQQCLLRRARRHMQGALMLRQRYARVFTGRAQQRVWQQYSAACAALRARQCGARCLRELSGGGLRVTRWLIRGIDTNVAILCYFTRQMLRYYCCWPVFAIDVIFFADITPCQRHARCTAPCARWRHVDAFASACLRYACWRYYYVLRRCLMLDASAMLRFADDELIDADKHTPLFTIRVTP